MPGVILSEAGRRTPRAHLSHPPVFEAITSLLKSTAPAFLANPGCCLLPPCATLHFRVYFLATFRAQRHCVRGYGPHPYSSGLRPTSAAVGKDRRTRVVARRRRGGGIRRRPYSFHLTVWKCVLVCGSSDLELALFFRRCRAAPMPKCPDPATPGAAASIHATRSRGIPTNQYLTTRKTIKLF